MQSYIRLAIVFSGRTEVTVAGKTLATRALVWPPGGTFPTSPAHVATDPEPPPPPPPLPQTAPPHPPPLSRSKHSSFVIVVMCGGRRRGGRSSSSPPAPHALRFQSTRGCGRAPPLELLGGDVARSTGHAAGGEQRVW
jgi:hypothetical protein